MRDLYHRLVANGFDTWLDEEKLMPGQDWDLEIRKAVRQVDVVVVCLSKGSVTKAGYVQKEIRFALDVADEQPEGAIFLIPLRLEDCQVPTRLGKMQWVDLYSGDGYRRLFASLKIRANVLGLNTSKREKRFSFEPKMIRIHAGPFLMGSTSKQIEESVEGGGEEEFIISERYQHVVELSEYFIGKYPITNHEYQAFVKDTDYHSPEGWKNNNYPKDMANYPVVNVTWYDAVAYCGWLSILTGKNYRLPTEAEWEKAARGTDGRVWPWGNTFHKNYANTNEAGIQSITLVNRFARKNKSPYGCVDMIGNVWEWSADRFNFEEEGYIKRVGKIIKNPRGYKHGTGRGQRGGSYYSDKWMARCAMRWGSEPGEWHTDEGFRVVYSLEPTMSEE